MRLVGDERYVIAVSVKGQEGLAASSDTVAQCHHHPLALAGRDVYRDGVVLIGLPVGVVLVLVRSIYGIGQDYKLLLHAILADIEFDSTINCLTILGIGREYVCTMRSIEGVDLPIDVAY